MEIPLTVLPQTLLPTSDYDEYRHHTDDDKGEDYDNEDGDVVMMIRAMTMMMASTMVMMRTT